jgi:hypothetical protein
VENLASAPSPAPGGEVVRYRPATGRIRYLIRAYREKCRYCATGTRVVSLWATGPQAEEVSWCGHCFNATCELLTLTPEQRFQAQALRQASTHGKSYRTWAAARPAIEDLERRGLF